MKIGKLSASLPKFKPLIAINSNYHPFALNNLRGHQELKTIASFESSAQLINEVEAMVAKLRGEILEVQS